MNPLKTIVDEAARRFPLETSPDWAPVFANETGFTGVARVDTDPATIQTIDCLFDGEATVHLADDRMFQARVFGRWNGRRAEVDRMRLLD